MTQEQENKEVIQQFYAAFCERDWVSLRSMLTDDLVYWTAGSTAVSGTTQGGDAYVDQSKSIFGNLEDAPNLDIIQMTAEGDRVAVEANSTMTFAGGIRYTNEYHLLITLRDGKIASVREYMDTQHVVDVLGRIEARAALTAANS